MKSILTLEDVRRVAPAAFTEAPAADLSSRYAHVTTADVLQRLQTDDWEITGARQNWLGSHHAIHEVRLGHPAFPANGEYRVELVLGNSSDGTSALHFFAGVARFICLNGLLIGDRVTNVTSAHRGLVREQALELAGSVRGRFVEIGGVVERWREIRLKEDQRRTFALSGLKLRWPGREPEADLAEVLQVRRGGDAGDSLWDTYNRVQEAMTRGGFKVRFTEGGITRRMGQARKLGSIRRDIGLNQQLWNLAEQFAN